MVVVVLVWLITHDDNYEDEVSCYGNNNDVEDFCLCGQLLMMMMKRIFVMGLIR